MNINTTTRHILYFLVVIGLSLLLYREYTYIHPYNPGMGWLGPKWTYFSTKTISWWFIFISSFLLVTPLIKKQLIGFLGLILFISVAIRPLIQNKFPEETVHEFYAKRKKQLNEIVNKTEIKDQTLMNQEINNAGFEKLIVKDSIYYFFFCHEDFLFGICKSQRQNLPKNTENFGRNIKFNEIEKDWYELDY